MTNETIETNVVETTNVIPNGTIVKKPKRQRVSQEQFFETWEQTAKEGGTIGDVARKLNAKQTSVQSRASQLRTKGIPLSQLTRAKGGGGGKKITLEESLAMLAKIRGVALEEVVKESQALTNKAAPVE